MLQECQIRLRSLKVEIEPEVGLPSVWSQGSQCSKACRAIKEASGSHINMFQESFLVKFVNLFKNNILYLE